MLEFDPLGAFADFVMMIVQPFISFILGFFPDADPQVYALIDSFANAAPSMTFNVFWFVDWSAVGLCLATLVTVAFVCVGFRFFSAAIQFASEAIEKIPFIE